MEEDEEKKKGEEGKEGEGTGTDGEEEKKVGVADQCCQASMKGIEVGDTEEEVSRVMASGTDVEATKVESDTEKSRSKSESEAERSNSEAEAVRSNSEAVGSNSEVVGSNSEAVRSNSEAERSAVAEIPNPVRPKSDTEVSENESQRRKAEVQILPPQSMLARPSEASVAAVVVTVSPKVPATRSMMELEKDKARIHLVNTDQMSRGVRPPSPLMDSLRRVPSPILGSRRGNNESGTGAAGGRFNRIEEETEEEGGGGSERHPRPVSNSPPPSPTTGGGTCITVGIDGQTRRERRGGEEPDKAAKKEEQPPTDDPKQSK